MAPDIYFQSLSHTLVLKRTHIERFLQIPRSRNLPYCISKWHTVHRLPSSSCHLNNTHIGRYSISFNPNETKIHFHLITEKAFFHHFLFMPGCCLKSTLTMRGWFHYVMRYWSSTLCFSIFIQYSSWNLLWDRLQSYFF